MGFLKEAIDRIRHRRLEQSPQEIIAALKQEFAGVEPIELSSYNYLANDVEQPAFRMARDAVEILRVSSVFKARGEAIEARFVFKPVGPPVVLDLINYQTEDVIEPGHTLRFIFPEQAKKKIFTSSGNAQIYAKGAGDHRWIFNVPVSWAVLDTLR